MLAGIDLQLVQHLLNVRLDDLRHDGSLMEEVYLVVVGTPFGRVVATTRVSIFSLADSGYGKDHQGLSSHR
eukprot:8683514-Prorocentrum_lima.AAC.1